MHAIIADAVHPILRAGLDLRERLNAGELLHLEPEQEALVRLLDGLDATVVLEAPESDLMPIDLSEPDPADRERLMQGTVRYLLTCWLDELITTQTQQGETWREQPLESVLYSTPNGSARFWDEVRYAEARDDRDALEVAYWCVTLGFRGDQRDTPSNVDAWTTRIQKRLAQPTMPDAMPACLEPTIPGPRPADSAGNRFLAFSFWMTLACGAPVTAILWLRFGHGL